MISITAKLLISVAVYYLIIGIVAILEKLLP